MNEMIERVAKAIFEASMAMHAPQSWEKCNEGQKENVRRQARVAIEAMREPTVAMISSSAKCNIEPEMLLHRQRWQAMIDEALK